MALQIPRGERRFRDRRRASRRMLRPLLGLATLVFAGAAVVFALPVKELRAIDFSAKASDLMIGAGLGIDQVNVSGQGYTSDTDIFDVLDLPNVKTFAAFDSEAALKRIERIPWVDKAQITRVYPGTLDIVVRERTPAVIWTRGDMNYLVDATWRVLGPAPAGGPWVLPRVAGEGADREATLMLAALLRYPAVEREYAYGERVAERRWRIVLKNGTVLELGADREIESLAEIAGAPTLVSALKGVAMVVDLRTPGRVAVRPAARKLAKTAALGGSIATSGSERVLHDG
jgi:cell division protein FtsQ